MTEITHSTLDQRIAASHDVDAFFLELCAGVAHHHPSVFTNAISDALLIFHLAQHAAIRLLLLSLGHLGIRAVFHVAGSIFLLLLFLLRLLQEPHAALGREFLAEVLLLICFFLALLALLSLLTAALTASAALRIVVGCMFGCGVFLIRLPREQHRLRGITARREHPHVLPL